MGVKGLQYYVEHHCPEVCPVVSIGDLAEQHRIAHNCVPVLVVDGMSLLHKLYAPNFDWICGGQWFEFVTFLNEVILHFKAIGVKLVFFFDGTVCTSKRQEWSSRRVKRGKDICFIFSFLKRNGIKPDDKHFQLPTSMGTLTRFALKFHTEVEVYTTIREADQEISHYARVNPNVFAILSQDSDFMIYDTKLYLSASHLDLSTLTTVLYDREKLAANLGLHLRQMPLFSCLVGNDIVSSDILKKFHQWLCQKYNYRPSIENVAPCVSHLINSCGWLGNEWNTDELVTISRKVFGTDHMFQLFQKALMTYSVELEEIPMTSVPFVSPEMIKLVYHKHIHCENVPPVYNLLCNLEYESSEVMEDPADKSLPPSAFVYRPARQRMYTVLFGCTSATGSDRMSLRPQRPHTAATNITVKEWCAYEGNSLEHPELVKPLPIHLPGGEVPSLELLWCGGSEVNNLRLSCFLACLGIPMTPTKLKSLDPNFVTLCCVLNYLLSYRKPLLAPWEVVAFIAQAVSPRARNLSQLMNIKVSSLETRAMHLVSLFMRGVVTVITILGTCGYPFPLQHAMPWCFFDGKLFHQLYIQAKDGASVEDLCEHNEKAVGDFYHLLEAVIMGTPLASKKMFQSL